MKEKSLIGSVQMHKLYNLYCAYCHQCKIQSIYSAHDLEIDLYNRFNNKSVTIDFIQRIVRTNFFDKKENDPLIVKLTGDEFAYEFFVYHEDFEGVYIKESMISRGGIRLSSYDMYRDEALALYRTQSLKNACIVPNGGKGCFISRTENAKSSYLSFINAILSITDDIKHGEVKKYKYSLDDIDTYFVVAPDKGTGYWLDDANILAKDRWIKSAFASSGKDGLNHKKMGITSKGAWICAQYHFNRCNIDQNNISTIGVGDMSGDVFGNGMLMSENIKLYAAFNDKEIFIDTMPNENSYVERKRLFDNQLTWKYYQDHGAYIYNRHDSLITLNDNVRKLLNINANTIIPEQLIEIILKMDIDLIWFGGIGTYIGDNYLSPSSIRAKVIVEGANLAVTQKARAMLKSAINTDYFDNSGGVQCSDYEVLLKTMGIDNVLPFQNEIEEIILDNFHKDNMLLDHMQQNYDIEEDDIVKLQKFNRYNNILSRSEICELISLTKKQIKEKNIHIPIDKTAEYILQSKMPKIDINLIKKHPLIQDILKILYINYAIHKYTPLYFLRNDNYNLVSIVKEIIQIDSQICYYKEKNDQGII